MDFTTTLETALRAQNRGTEIRRAVASARIPQTVNHAAPSKRTNVRLWIFQGALAALFLFAGASKLVMPADQLSANTDLPVAFLRFIGLCETLGAVGLVLPWALNIRSRLTPLAAAGLVIIMVGAAVLVAATESPALALVNVAIAAVAGSVAYERRAGK